MRLRLRFLVLISLALLPAVAVQFHFERQARAMRQDSARAEALRIVRLIAADIESVVEGGRQFLAAIASFEELSGGDDGRCSARLRMLSTNVPRYANFAVADPSGLVVCSALIRPVGQSVADLSHVQLARQTGRFAVGNDSRELGSGLDGLHFTSPLRPELHGRTGVLIAALDLEWLTERLAHIPLPADGRVLIADRNGHVLASWPEPPRALGRPAHPALEQAIATRQLLAHGELGKLGGRMLHAAIPVGDTTTGLFVAVSLDVDGVELSIESAERRAMWLIFGGALAAIGLGLFFARRYLERPVQALVDAMKRWRDGERTARATADPRLANLGEKDEFRRIADSFDHAAEAVTAREAALRASEAMSRLAQEAGSVGIYERDFRTARARWSATMCRIWGIDPARAASGVLEREYLALLLPEDAPAHRAYQTTMRYDPAVTHFEIEFRIRHGVTGEIRWILNRGEYVRDAGGRVLLSRGTNLDVTERKAAEAALRDSEARLNLAQEAASIGLFERDLRTGRAFWTPAMFHIRGLPHAAAGACWITHDYAELLLPDDATQRQAYMKAIYADPTVMRYEMEYRIRRADTGAVRWICSRGEYERDASGSPVLVRGTNQDITDRKAAEARQTLLMREVDHRAKNALAVVQAALRLTPKDDPEAYARAVEGRVAALARAQTILAEGRWTGADLRALLTGELTAFLAGQQVDLHGPPVTIPATAAQPLAMAVHELAPNAVKHGALSCGTGSLSITWRTEAMPGMPACLRLAWVENGGPALTGISKRRGFGSRVIETTIERQMGGRLRLHWAPQGLRCELEIPMEHDAPANLHG